jgi:hypothetical protein
MSLQAVRDRHLRHLAPEIAGRETLAAQQLPLSPLSPISILVISRESNLTPPFCLWVGARKKACEQNLPKNLAEIAEIAETAAAQRLLAPVSSSREGGDKIFGRLQRDVSNNVDHCCIGLFRIEWRERLEDNRLPP